MAIYNGKEILSLGANVLNVDGETAYTEGYNYGLYEGKKQGYTEGYTEGETAGIEQGFTKGQLDAVQSAEALKGSLSVNNTANITDISPYKHIVGCSIDRVNMCYQKGTIYVGDIGLTVSYDETTDTYIVNGTVTKAANVTLTNGIDIPVGTYRVRITKVSGSIGGTTGSLLLGIFDTSDGNLFLSNRPNLGGTNANNSVVSASGCSTPSNWSGIARVYLQCSTKGMVFDNFTFKIGISKYEYTALPYVPDLSAITLKVGASVDDENAQTFTCNADGTINGEITSIYPEMLISSNISGVRIMVNYTKDIDAAFNALSTAIAMSGGE
jgi:hypothetical protein